jgi:DNA-binding NtrC family response regulator
MQPHILVADDERSIRLMLETGLSLNGFKVTAVRTGKEAVKAAESTPFDAVLSDVYMPDGSGLELVEELRINHPTMPIILMTAQGSLNAAVDAVAKGATDFIAKPFEIAEVVGLLRRFLEAQREAESRQDSTSGDDDLTGSGLIGRSAPMVIVYKLIAQAARTNATVLITGESGTGKELVARSIHDYSARASRPFLSVNCSGLTDTLLESELFGYTKGSFTGAMADRGGLFEAADGGTLFLDELASTSPAFQASLLRVLQSGEVRRVGSTQTRRVNVRVIGASNAPLRSLVEAGSFRSDLYYRLTVLSIELPPLRARTGDVALLTEFFLKQFAGDGPLPHLTTEARQALAAHPFPGNVRELENALRRALAVSSNGVITIDCLPPEIAEHRLAKRGDATSGHSLIADRPSMDELQRRYMELVLLEASGNRRRAAAILKLDRRTVQRLIARYKLESAAPENDEPEEDAGPENEF